MPLQIHRFHEEIMIKASLKRTTKFSNGNLINKRNPSKFLFPTRIFEISLSTIKGNAFQVFIITDPYYFFVGAPTMYSKITQKT